MSFLDDACSLHRLDEPEDMLGLLVVTKTLTTFLATIVLHTKTVVG